MFPVYQKNYLDLTTAAMKSELSEELLYSAATVKESVSYSPCRECTVEI